MSINKAILGIKYRILILNLLRLIALAVVEDRIKLENPLSALRRVNKELTDEPNRLEKEKREQREKLRG